MSSQLVYAVITYDIVKGSYPISLKNSFERMSDTHTYGLKSTSTNPQDLVVPLPKVKQVGDNFFNVSPKLWNDIPDEIKNAKNRNIFKKCSNYLDCPNCSNETQKCLRGGDPVNPKMMCCNASNWKLSYLPVPMSTVLDRGPYSPGRRE